MSRLMKLLVTGLVTMLALATAALPAHASPAGDAAGWIASRTAGVTTVGEAADAALALAAAKDPALQEQVDQLLALIARDGAGALDGSPEMAAKLAIVAVAFGKDPADLVPGQDLVSIVEGGIAADGSFGAWPGPFATGLAATALERTGRPVPEALITQLLTLVNDDGGFGFGAGEPSDADSTGMALLALLAADSPEAAAAAEKATTWAQENQAEDGSWAGFNPVNSTAIMGGALLAAGVDQTKATAWLEGQQAASGAFTNNGADDFLATTQAALLLGSASYLDVTAVTASPAPPASTAATGDGPDALPWIIGGGLAALALVTAWVLVRRSRAAR